MAMPSAAALDLGVGLGSQLPDELKAAQEEQRKKLALAGPQPDLMAPISAVATLFPPVKNA